MGDVRFTPRAEADLEEIWRQLALRDLKAADRVIRRIGEKAQLAADVPGMGAPRPRQSARARILIEWPYVILYEPNDIGILVIAVVHGMRDPERWLT